MNEANTDIVAYLHCTKYNVNNSLGCSFHAECEKCVTPQDI